MKNIALHYEEYMYVHCMCVYVHIIFFNFTIALIQVLFRISLEVITLLYYLHIHKETNI